MSSKRKLLMPTPEADAAINRGIAAAVTILNSGQRKN